MTITSAVVLFAMTWFLVFFCLLPVRFRSQAEAGHIEPGTPASAPAEPMVARKAKWTTAIAVVVWAILSGIIMSGWISVADLNWTTEMIVAPPGN